MVENYIVEEARDFCSEFIAGVSSIGLNSSVIKRDSNVDRALSTSSFIRPSKEQLDQAHLYVIQNVNDVLPYVEQHMESLCKLNFGKTRSKKWIQEEHNCSFSRWLSTWVALALKVPKNSITPSLRWIAHGPSPDCDWVDNRSGVKVDELGFTIVDLKRIGTTEEDFFEDEIGDMLQECGYETIQRMPNVDTPNETDDTNSTYIRHDCKGRWVEKGLKTWQVKHDLQRYRSTPKWRPVKFNTKNAYRQEEIDEIRTKWAAFVSRFVGKMGWIARNIRCKTKFTPTRFRSKVSFIPLTTLLLLPLFSADEEGTYLVPEVEPLWNFLVEIATFASTPTQGHLPPPFGHAYELPPQFSIE
ncbi:transposon protein, putative, CACTA, En/Spm sub-class [Cucumis melo var. makuwa]|uniref:Transposon protein, putative, CACTA, En/Spm sub-class n=1 Tax=Cucumis melo var. makuwa TaxID=1194695 RepID=A0A5A7T5X2_CUCMM|nr:transposon protein, putative, CACTA, En/Spm sub-class [Cucumis melo var. makuwa]TYK30657.1 transposon protein, putative, CACTA, En/Spm sub-class [Cucumis melo var. makuwa]